MQNVIIRSATADDAKDFCKLQVDLSKESDFLLMTLDEIQERCVEEQKNIFDQMAQDKLPGRVLLAYVDNDLAGFIGYRTNSLERIRHVVNSVAVGVLQKYQNRGVATALFKECEELWSGGQMKRVEFSVNVRNSSAIKLYKKLGYSIEATKEKAVCIDGVFQDEYGMMKMLG